MRRARNPDLLGDLILAGAVIGGIYVVAKRLSGAPITLVPGNPLQGIERSVNDTVGGIERAVNDILGTGILPGGVSHDKLCEYVANWKLNQVVFNPLHLIFPPADPSDWNAFRNYARTPILGLGYDPGPTPPDCWGTNTATTGGEPTFYEGLRPGGLGY